MARPDVVPVLVLSGVVGSGKSTIGRCVARQLKEADSSYALIDHEWMAYSWPVPLDDPWNERVAGQNLACAWLNFRAAGAERLVYCRVLEARSLLRHVKDAVPGAVPTVVQLRAPLELIHHRLSAREPEPGWYLNAATELASRMNTSKVADFIVDNGARPPNEVAREILGLLRWPI
jgi:shikimate kinase